MSGLVIVSNGVYRGPRPMTKDAWDQLVTFKINTVLNLESGFFERSHAKVNDEFWQVASRGMMPSHLEMSDIFPPTKYDIVAALNVIKRGLPIYVHCLHGVDRTGVICAGFRVVCGWSVDNAIEEMLLLGFHKVCYGWWIKSVRETLTEIRLKL